MFVYVRGTRAWPPTGLIPCFSKTEGNTYATLLHHPFLFKGKPMQCSRGSKKDFWRCCRGVYAQLKTYQVPITNSYPSHYIICHLPLVFLSPTSPLPFYSPSFSVRLLFASVLNCLLVMMAQDNTKLCDFTNTNNNDFISTPTAPLTDVESCEINTSLLNLFMKLVVLFNHQQLMLSLISTFVDFSIMKSSGIAFVIPCIL